MQDDEIVDVADLLLVLGCVNTTDFIVNGIRAFLQNTRQLSKLRDRPDLIDKAVNEVLRFDSPVLGTLRIADRDMRRRHVSGPARRNARDFDRRREPRRRRAPEARSIRHRTLRYAASRIRRRAARMPGRDARAHGCHGSVDRHRHAVPATGTQPSRLGVRFGAGVPPHEVLLDPNVSHEQRAVGRQLLVRLDRRPAAR